MDKACTAVCKVVCNVVKFDFEKPFVPGETFLEMGSGWFVDVESISKNEQVLQSAANGSRFVVTNAHVIDSASHVSVAMEETGDQMYAATVCGVCFAVDLAVLRVDDPRCPARSTLRVGDSYAVRVGESVVSLGHPLGYKQLEMTQGVLSGSNQGLLTTTSALNPGNSGGPLLDKRGNVIGINVSVARNSQAIDFAVPSHQLVAMFDLLATRPSTALVLFQPTVGCSFINTTPALLRYLDTGGTTGVRVVDVLRDFPMHNAGIRNGDVVTRFNGFEIDTFGDCAVPWQHSRTPLQSVIGMLTHNSTPAVEFVRDGTKRTVELALADAARPGFPHMRALRMWFPPFDEPDYQVLFGLVLMPLCRNHVDVFHNDRALMSIASCAATGATAQRVIVSAVLGGSRVAESKVISAPCVVAKVNERTVRTLDEFRDAARHPIVRGRSAFFLLETDDNELVALDFDDALRDEPALSKAHRFRLPPLFAALQQDANERKRNNDSASPATQQK